MKFGWNEGIGLGGAIVNGVNGASQAKASKENLRRQAEYAKMRNQQFARINPVYEQMVMQYAQSMGLGGAEGVNQLGANHFSLGGGPSRNQQFGMGGEYGTYDQQLRLQAGEEDINRYAQQQANQLRHQAGQRGVAPEIAAAMQARNQAGAGQQYSQFRRGLAMSAEQDRERKYMQLMAMMGQGLGGGSEAAGIYAQQGAMQGQQANQAFGAMGQTVSDWQQQRAMQQYLASQNPAAPGVAGPTSAAPWAGTSSQGLADRYTQPRNWWDDL